MMFGITKADVGMSAAGFNGDAGHASCWSDDNPNSGDSVTYEGSAWCSWFDDDVSEALVRTTTFASGYNEFSRSS